MKIKLSFSGVCCKITNPTQLRFESAWHFRQMFQNGLAGLKMMHKACFWVSPLKRMVHSITWWMMYGKMVGNLFSQFFLAQMKKRILKCKDYWEFCSVFPILGYLNWMHTTTWWRWILENKKRFLFIRYPFTKTSLIFATAIKVWKLQFNLYSLFFRVLKIFNIFLF